MKAVKFISAFVLWVVVFGLGYWLYSIINKPVQFEKDYNNRRTATIDRLEDIREAQSLYLKATGFYAGDFDELVNTIKNQEFTEVKIIGNEDDTSVVTTYDTIRYYIKDRLDLVGTSTLDSLKYIPYSGGQIFALETDTIKQQRVELSVYQVIATKEQFLNGMESDRAKDRDDLVLGSLMQATDQGNWE